MPDPCRCSVWVGCGFGQLALVGAVAPYGRGLQLDELSGPFQPKFSMILKLGGPVGCPVELLFDCLCYPRWGKCLGFIFVAFCPELAPSTIPLGLGSSPGMCRCRACSAQSPQAFQTSGRTSLQSYCPGVMKRAALFNQSYIR